MKVVLYVEQKCCVPVLCWISTNGAIMYLRYILHCLSTNCTAAFVAYMALEVSDSLLHTKASTGSDEHTQKSYIIHLTSFSKGRSMDNSLTDHPWGPWLLFSLTCTASFPPIRCHYKGFRSQWRSPGWRHNVPHRDDGKSRVEAWGEYILGWRSSLTGSPTAPSFVCHLW